MARRGAKVLVPWRKQCWVWQDQDLCALPVGPAAFCSSMETPVALGQIRPQPSEIRTYLHRSLLPLSSELLQLPGVCLPCDSPGRKDVATDATLGARHRADYVACVLMFTTPDNRRYGGVLWVPNHASQPASQRVGAGSVSEPSSHAIARSREMDVWHLSAS